VMTYLIRQSCLVFTTFLLVTLTIQKAFALEDVLAVGVSDQAVAYGKSQVGFGYSALFGKNWQEGSMGILVTLYTPYMMLASRAAKIERTEDDAKKTALRKSLKKEISFYRYNPQDITVKILVSLYGDADTFLNTVKVSMKGFGLGRYTDLKPIRRVVDTKARYLETRHGVKVYTGDIALYLPWADFKKLETFSVTITGDPEKNTSSGLGQPVTLQFVMDDIR
jgi:hypothetical protein